MKLIGNLIFVFFFSLVLLGPSVAAQDTPPWMTLTKREIKEEVWPEIQVSAKIETDSLTAAGIFAAYDYQKEYIPNLLESRVVLEEVTKEANKTDVKYTLDMPWPLSDSHYTHGHVVSLVEENTYKIRWYVVKSDSAELVQGHAIFSPHPENPKHTRLHYVSLVRPKSFLAGIFKKIMVGDVIKSLTAIKLTTEKLAMENPELTEKYRDKIRQVLSGKPAYLP